MALIILQLIVLPLVVGMLLNARFPHTVAKIRPWVQRLSLLLFFTILVLAITGNLKNMVDYLGFVFVLVAVHNLAGISAGYGLGRWRDSPGWTAAPWPSSRGCTIPLWDCCLFSAFSMVWAAWRSLRRGGAFGIW